MRTLHPDLVPYIRGYNTARDYIEALVIERTAAGAPLAHIRDTKAQWAEADGGASAVDAIFTRFDDGTLRLKDTTNTLFTRTSHPNNQTDLDRVDPFDASLIEWGGTDSSDIEILRVKLWLNPRVSGAQRREVDRWRLLLFARTVTDANGNYYAPLAEPLDVLVTGDTAGEVTFDYSGRSARPKPKSVNPVNELPDQGGTFLGNPVTLFQVIALTASGDSAGNVALGVNDAETSFTSTGNTLTRRRFKNFGWFQDQGVALGVPHIVLENGTYAASGTITFSSGNLFDLGATPTKDVELIGIGQTPPGTSITYRVRNAADSGYTDFTNGQFENADLAMALVQSKKMQVVLTSNAAGTVSPTLRRLGRQAINRIDFSRVASIEGYEQAFDPESHKVEIPRPRLVAVKDGPRDFSSKIEKLLAENFVNDIRIRWLVGDKALGRSKWTHMDDFLVLDSTPRQPVIELQLVGLCALLKDLAPPFSPGTNYAPDGTQSIGTWTDLAGGTTNIHLHIDEAVADETDGIRSVTSPSNTEYIWTEPTPTDLPGRRLFLDVDYAKDQSGGEQIDAKFRIYNASTLVMESALQTNVGPDRVQKQFELTEAQIGQLTDLANLRGAVVANAPSPGTGRRLHLYWARVRSGGKRESVTYTNQTLKAVYDDLLANRLAIPANLRGPGVENTTTTVSKQITGLRKRGPNVKEVVAKTEVEAIAFLADRLIGSSEGKIKAFDVSPSQPIKAVFRSRRIKIGDASPGHERRLPEFFVGYRWDAENEEFKDEVRAFHSQSILRIGTLGLGPPQWLDEEISKWIDSDALAESIGRRIVERLGTGEMLWSFSSVDRYPELEVGDIVAVETDLFVSRDPNINQEIKGRRWAVGPLQRVGSGRFFTVHPRGYADILSDAQLASRLRAEQPVDPEDMVFNGGFENVQVNWAEDTSGIVGATGFRVTASNPGVGRYSALVEALAPTGGGIIQVDGDAIGEVDAASGIGVNSTTPPFLLSVVAGDILRVQASVFDSDTRTKVVGFRRYDVNKAFVADATVLSWSANSGTWVTKEGVYLVPSGTAFLAVVAQWSGGAVATISHRFDGIRVWRGAATRDLGLKTTTPGANTPTLGTNYPGGGSTPTKWIQVQLDDGTTVLVPGWPT